MSEEIPKYIKRPVENTTTPKEVPLGPVIPAKEREGILTRGEFPFYGIEVMNNKSQVKDTGFSMNHSKNLQGSKDSPAFPFYGLSNKDVSSQISNGGFDLFHGKPYYLYYYQ